jgi:hypothetical protein
MALATSGAVVLAASLYLYVQVRAAPSTPSQAAIDEAKARVPAVRAPTGPDVDLWATGAVGSPQARAEATRTALVGPAATRIEPSSAPPTTTVEPTLQVDQPSVDDELKSGDGMTIANKMFDRGDYDDAMKQALKMLDTDPKNPRMLRIVVSSACFMGDPDRAQKYWAQLADERDRAQMAVRCGRYGITFKQ